VRRSPQPKLRAPPDRLHASRRFDTTSLDAEPSRAARAWMTRACCARRAPGSSAANAAAAAMAARCSVGSTLIVTHRSVGVYLICAT